MNNRRINASYTNTENHNLHEGLLLSAVSVISKGDKVLIITKNTHTVSQVEQWVQKWAVLSFSLYMWHLQGPDIPLKVASICSSVLPLVSGTKTMVKMTFRMHMEANSQKVPALVRRFCKANRYPGGGGRKRENEREREQERARERARGGWGRPQRTMSKTLKISRLQRKFNSNFHPCIKICFHSFTNCHSYEFNCYFSILCMLERLLQVAEVAFSNETDSYTIQHPKPI